MRSKLEYIWLDGYAPTQNMRSKTKVVEDFDGTLESCPIWAFDGSSTRQADGSSSDCLLKPVAIFPDPNRINGFLVMTEVLNADGTPHDSNARSQIDDDDDDSHVPGGAGSPRLRAAEMQPDWQERNRPCPAGVVGCSLSFCFLFTQRRLTLHS